ncbi:hypothetical protein IMCC26207_106168 [Actinobacteria bacterium IMCC26207]|nr:hypothetical protein IMCC26207_106168 [Actinobacteria bacterium IMCC26207]
MCLEMALVPKSLFSALISPYKSTDPLTQLTYKSTHPVTQVSLIVTELIMTALLGSWDGVLRAPMASTTSVPSVT